MNILGIEIRPTLAVLALREAPHRPRLVGDGRCSVIPLALGAGELWGSEAAAQPEHGWDGVAPLVSPPPFWRRLGERMQRFLGVPANLTHGYRAVVASSPGSLGSPLEDLARAAGFDVMEVIAPPQAAVARWLAESSSAEDRERTVGVVTVGDVAAEAAAFVVRVGRFPSVVRAAFAEPLSGTGAGYWSRHVVAEVLGHAADDGVCESRFALWRSAMEFGERMRRAPPRRAVFWTGPLVEELISPVSFTVDDFVKWREVETFTDWLPRAVRDAARGLGLSRLDALLVGGAGAHWPLADEAWAGLPRPIISGDPSADVAAGATWWPLLRAVARPRDSFPETPRPAPPRLAPEPVDFRRAAPHSLPGLDPREFARLLDEQLKNSSTDNP